MVRLHLNLDRMAHASLPSHVEHATIDRLWSQSVHSLRFSMIMLISH